MKIIAFPFAGGNKYSFRHFFPKHLDVTVLEYPGRGTRIDEKLITNIDTLINDILFPEVIKNITSCKEYVIYGHSMGGLVGYLMCQKIEQLGLKRPNKFIVSGRKAPKYKRDKILSSLPDHIFWQEVVQLGGIPAEINKLTELVHYYVPIFKADFECIEKYNHVENKKLNIPISVFYGDDENITEIEATDWKETTNQNVDIFELKGNHFFIYQHSEFIISNIIDQIPDTQPLDHILKSSHLVLAKNENNE